MKEPIRSCGLCIVAKTPESFAHNQARTVSNLVPTNRLHHAPLCLPPMPWVSWQECGAVFVTKNRRHVKCRHLGQPTWTDHWRFPHAQASAGLPATRVGGAGIGPGRGRQVWRRASGGNPSGAVHDPAAPDPSNYLMVKEEFALSYNSKLGTPNWVSYRLHKADMGRARPRSPSFPMKTCRSGSTRSSRSTTILAGPA